MTNGKKFCIVGAGASGLAAASSFRALGIGFDCFEREDDIGGNWYYGKPNSSVYRSTRLISSKRQTEFADYPMPAEWPEHPGHEMVWQYLRGYADRFRLYENIQFNTSISRIEPAAAGGAIDGERARSPEVTAKTSTDAAPTASGWDVTLSDGIRRRYRGVVIANGHNWDPRWPKYPGEFHGRVFHSSQYKTPDVCRGERVLVVGGGNSGFDIAVDVAPWSSATFHSLRRGYHVLPRYVRGAPIDQCGPRWLPWRMPLWLRRLAADRAQRQAWGQAAAGLPRPDHRLFETHPVINSRWPYEIARRRISVKPDVQRLEGNHVLFADASRERIDTILYATGYKLSFPFIDCRHLNWRNDRPALYLNVFHPNCDDLFVAGLIQPDSGQFGLVELQAKLIAAYVRALQDWSPLARRFQAEKRRNADQPLGGGIRYVRSPRHAIEVEHASYRRRLQRWIGRFQSATATRSE